MKNPRLILVVLILCVLSAAAVTGYFLLKQMQTDINGLAAAGISAQKEVSSAQRDIAAMKSVQEELSRTVATLNESIQSVNQALGEKETKIVEIKNEQATQAGEVAALRTRAEKIENDTKNWQTEYIKALTGLEEKVNISGKQLHDEIYALTQTVKVAPAPAVAVIEKNKK